MFDLELRSNIHGAIDVCVEPLFGVPLYHSVPEAESACLLQLGVRLENTYLRRNQYKITLLNFGADGFEFGREGFEK